MAVRHGMNQGHGRDKPSCFPAAERGTLLMVSRYAWAQRRNAQTYGWRRPARQRACTTMVSVMIYHSTTPPCGARGAETLSGR